jgi:tRNA(His) 5'-end guanylyltransferase
MRAIEGRKCEDIPKLAMFDSRVWTIPDPTEVENSVIWRQKDASRNSISMAAQAVCSHKSLQGANQAQQQEMMFQKGINWDKYSDREKRGGICIKSENDGWQISQTIPIFTTDEGRSFLKEMIPKYDQS